MKSLIISIKIFLFFTVLTGIIYPFLITGVAQTVFPEKANGSLIIRDNKVIGSTLIGQQFDTAIYFSSRPSAISYNPLPSGGSNYGLTSTKLKKLFYEHKHQFIANNNLDDSTEVPSEMLFASASGLDPHISQKAAFLQVERIAKARNYTNDQKLKLIQLIYNHTETPQFSCLGEERINVLLLNLELDKTTVSDLKNR
jgi:potassium-transporting ATPase KdpC subunit